MNKKFFFNHKFFTILSLVFTLFSFSLGFNHSVFANTISATDNMDGTVSILSGDSSPFFVCYDATYEIPDDNLHSSAGASFNNPMLLTSSTVFQPPGNLIVNGVPGYYTCFVYEGSNMPLWPVSVKVYQEADAYVQFYWDGSNIVPPPSCSDGIQNQDETGIDFGGICPETETITSDITTSTTWDRGHLYLVSGDIEITSGDTLTIEPGTIVKFDTSTSSSITVNGTLIAEGDMGDEHSLGKIFFTSLKDDSLLGLDTNSDGNSTSPAGDDWGDIIVGSGGVATFDYVVVRYGGGGGSSAQIYNDGGDLTMSNSFVIHGTTYGIKNNSGTADISTTDLGFNDYGFYLYGGTAGVTPNNIIHDNSSYGIYNNTVSSINAEDNYWGDDTGPYNNPSNLTGTGNAVSGYVDFSPWDSNVHYVSNTPENEEYCDYYNECTSVYSGELLWKNVSVSSYSTELASALSTWDALPSVTITEDNSTPELEFREVDMNDVNWKGKWIPEDTPDKANLNKYYLDSGTSSQIQNTITHEIGHALGLNHSYSGNIMYFNQTSQTSLGPQDENDYNYLWP